MSLEKPKIGEVWRNGWDGVVAKVSEVSDTEVKLVLHDLKSLEKEFGKEDATELLGVEDTVSLKRFEEDYDKVEKF